MKLQLSGLDNPIEFDGTDALAEVLKRVLVGWKCARAAPDAPAKIRLKAGGRGYERRSPWVGEGEALVLPDPVDAVCDLLLDIERAYVEDAPSRGESLSMVLHAGAVEFGQGDGRGLVVFPSTHATGKSLMGAALAHEGLRIFADDQLPVLPGTPAVGIAPGFLPRLRRPLPDDLNASLAAFIRDREGPTSQRFRYLDPGRSGIAPVGEKAPIKGLVLLQRQQDAPPRLEAIKEAEVLKACVLQSFGRTLGALEVLDHLHAMVQGAKCFRLVYGDATEAVPLLKETFA